MAYQNFLPGSSGIFPNNMQSNMFPQSYNMPTYGTSTFAQTQYTQSQPISNNAIYGHLINSVDEITPPNNNPMIGQVGIFPLSDYSCVYIKGWDDAGNIKIEKFVSEGQQENEIVVHPNTGNQEILDRLDNIEKTLTSMSKRNNNYKNYKNKQYKNQNDTKSEEE